MSQNLLVYFVQLLEDDSLLHKYYFLRFLRNVCIFGNNGINSNQENIFKLYKKLNEQK